MIHKITAKNFYSFKDVIELKFEVNENAPDTDAYTKDADGNRLSKVMAVIGPNASGKTNLLKIIPFLYFLIADSFIELKPKDDIPFDSYKFMPKNNYPTELSVSFSFNQCLYEYFIKINQHQILEEKLRKYNKSTKHFISLFKRTWVEKENKYKYELANFSTSSKLKSIVEKRKNASLISTAAQIDHHLSNDIVEYWRSFDSNVVMSGKHNHPEFVLEAAKFYHENPEIKKRAEMLLSKFDLGLVGMRIEKHSRKSESGRDQAYYWPVCIHKGDIKDYEMDFTYESGGTQNLFVILSQILPVLKNGGVVILDEFDADLHPLMLPELINMFVSKTMNPMNAQLLFSTHHHEILNKLDKYQITLVEKKENNGAEVWRLDEIEGLRSDDNYYSKYIAGAYGAVPEV